MTTFDRRSDQLECCRVPTRPDPRSIIGLANQARSLVEPGRLFCRGHGDGPRGGSEYLIDTADLAIEPVGSNPLAPGIIERTQPKQYGARCVGPGGLEHPLRRCWAICPSRVRSVNSGVLVALTAVRSAPVRPVANRFVSNRFAGCVAVPQKTAICARTMAAAKASGVWLSGQAAPSPPQTRAHGGQPDRPVPAGRVATPPPLPSLTSTCCGSRCVRVWAVTWFRHTRKLPLPVVPLSFTDATGSRPIDASMVYISTKRHTVAPCTHQRYPEMVVWWWRQ